MKNKKLVFILKYLSYNPSFALTDLSNYNLAHIFTFILYCCNDSNKVVQTGHSPHICDKHIEHNIIEINKINIDLANKEKVKRTIFPYFQHPGVILKLLFVCSI